MEESVNDISTDVKSKHFRGLRTYHTSIASATKDLFESITNTIDSFKDDNASDVKGPLVTCMGVALEQFAGDIKVAFKDFVETATDRQFVDLNSLDLLKLDQSFCQSVSKSSPVYQGDGDDEDNDEIYGPLDNEIFGEKDTDSSKEITLKKEENDEQNKDTRDEDINDNTENIESEIDSDATIEGESEKENDKETPTKKEKSTRKQTKKTKKQTCPFCSNIYSSKPKLLKHIKSTHMKEVTEPRERRERVKSVKPISTKTRAGSRADNRAESKQIANSKSKCNICGKEFSCSSNLAKHMRNKHLKVSRDRECPLCNKSFHSFFILQKHMAKEHSIKMDKRYECIVCGKTFPSNELFVEHAKTHTIEVAPVDEFDLGNNEDDGGDLPGIYDEGVDDSLVGKDTNPEEITFESSLKLEEVGLEPKTPDANVENESNAAVLSDVEKDTPDVRPKKRRVPGQGLTKDKRRTCPFCFRTYSDKSNLKKHIRFIHKKEPRIYSPRVRSDDSNSSPRDKCDICGKQFSNSSNLSKHMRIKHLDVSTVRHCHVCEKDFPTYYVFERHMFKKHSIKPNKRYNCIVCGTAFGDKEEFIEHAKTHIGEEKKEKTIQTPQHFQCPLCPQTFIRRDCLKSHNIAVHNYESKFKCKQCDIYFISQFKLNLHDDRIHSGKKNFTCEFCARSFFTHDTLRAHIVARHGVKTDYRCELCGKYFPSSYTLKRHMKDRHGNTRDHLCADCGRDFKTKGQLKQHTKLHTGIFDYTCQYCQKGFRWQSSLECHIATAHQTTTPYGCKSCQMRFKTKNALRYHEKKQHDTGPPMVFECQLCSVTCSVKSSINRHMKRKHIGHMDMFRHVPLDEASSNKPVPERISKKQVMAHRAPRYDPPNNAPEMQPQMSGVYTGPEDLSVESQIANALRMHRVMKETEGNPVPENPIIDQQNRMAQYVPHQNPNHLNSPFSLTNLSTFYM